MDQQQELRSLPSVEALSRQLADVPRAVAVRSARDAVASARANLLAGEAAGDIEANARARATAALGAGLRPVLNATGVVLHTNLGRAPLAAEAADAVFGVTSGYSNLEYDLGTGGRGSRQAHVEDLLQEVTGAEAALVVNNCAAAVLLAVAALANRRELVISRGQLLEIGGGFRMPEVVAQSGARLVEVGTTNRTRLEDYRRALGPETGGILRAHPSNFRSLGFVEEVPVEAVCGLGVAVIDDVGSGLLAEELRLLDGEPPVRRSVRAGCALVCFSGDKLLGGPQAGLIVGQADAVGRCRSHPLARAVRIDKLSLAALEATLRLYLDPGVARAKLPVLRMLAASEGALRARAEDLRVRLRAAGVSVELVRSMAKVGGGALPLLELEGPACAVDPLPLALDELTRRLRQGRWPLIGRAHEGRLLLDPRTLDDEEARVAAEAVVAALR